MALKLRRQAEVFTNAIVLRPPSGGPPETLSIGILGVSEGRHQADGGDDIEKIDPSTLHTGHLRRARQQGIDDDHQKNPSENRSDDQACGSHLLSLRWTIQS